MPYSDIDGVWDLRCENGPSVVPTGILTPFAQYEELANAHGITPHRATGLGARPRRTTPATRQIQSFFMALSPNLSLPEFPQLSVTDSLLTQILLLTSKPMLATIVTQVRIDIPRARQLNLPQSAIHCSRASVIARQPVATLAQVPLL